MYRLEMVWMLRHIKLLKPQISSIAEQIQNRWQAELQGKVEKEEANMQGQIYRLLYSRFLRFFYFYFFHSTNDIILNWFANIIF